MIECQQANKQQRNGYMELPPDFLSTLDTDSRESFLQDMVLKASEADAYDGDLDADMRRLQSDIMSARTVVTFDDESGSFSLLRRD